MFALIALLGLGLAITAFIDSDDNSDVNDVVPAESTPDEFTDDGDAVISTSFLDDYDAALADLVTEGEISTQDAAAIRAATNFPEGLLNIDTGAGDDGVLGSNGNDTIATGTGDDVAHGGEGDDRIDLGTGADTSGIDGHAVSGDDDIIRFPINYTPVGEESELEAGDDTILAGAGNDAVADGYGSNVILGNQGNDFLVAVDQDGGAADTVNGGSGDDWIFADEGDRIITGGGRDEVTLDLFNGVGDDYEVATITDFVQGRDTLVLEGDSALLRAPTPSGSDAPVVNPISLAELTDDEDNVIGATVLISGTAVLNVIGGEGLTLADIQLST